VNYVVLGIVLVLVLVLVSISFLQATT